VSRSTALFLGGTVAATQESGTNATQTFEQLVGRVGEAEASRRAFKVFAKNILLNTALNRLGVFAPEGTALGRALKGFSYEGVQQIIDNTAILLNKITLLAVVGGNEVTNPFMVTEVYVRRGDSWKLGSLSFTRLLAQ
jgi:hypothetical protein